MSFFEIWKHIIDTYLILKNNYINTYKYSCMSKILYLKIENQILYFLDIISVTLIIC